MLSDKSLYPTLPVVDFDRARKFYEETLGLKVIMADKQAGMWLAAGAGCILFLYQRRATKADHTVLSFDVDDVMTEVNELKSRGVKFEEYDIPEMGLKTVNGVAAMPSPLGEIKGAWFKDTEGNIIGLAQSPKSLKDRIMPQMPTGAMK